MSLPHSHLTHLIMFAISVYSSIVKQVNVSYELMHCAMHSRVTFVINAMVT